MVGTRVRHHCGDGVADSLLGCMDCMEDNCYLWAGLGAVGNNWFRESIGNLKLLGEDCSCRWSWLNLLVSVVPFQLSSDLVSSQLHGQLIRQRQQQQPFRPLDVYDSCSDCGSNDVGVCHLMKKTTYDAGADDRGCSPLDQCRLDHHRTLQGLCHSLCYAAGNLRVPT